MVVYASGGTGVGGSVAAGDAGISSSSSLSPSDGGGQFMYSGGACEWLHTCSRIHGYR